MYGRYNEYLQIPEGYDTSFQIKVNGAKNISYTVSEGESVEVSETGLINLRWVIALNPDCTFSDMAFEEDFGGTIYGYNNSTAQTYAEKYGYTFDVIENAGNILINRPIGDANCDDTFNVSDAAFIARTLAKGQTISFEENPFADFNWDNKVTVSDAAAIARELAMAKNVF